MLPASTRRWIAVQANGTAILPSAASARYVSPSITTSTSTPAASAIPNWKHCWTSCCMWESDKVVFYNLLIYAEFNVNNFLLERYFYFGVFIYFLHFWSYPYLCFAIKDNEAISHPDLYINIHTTGLMTAKKEKYIMRPAETHHPFRANASSIGAKHIMRFYNPPSSWFSLDIR